jgi:hypothetical protein
MAENFTEADGHQLAADMLREVREEYFARERDDMTDAEISALWHTAEPEALARYMNTVRNSGSAALERGFYQVLTDVLGNDDVSPEPDFYERSTEASRG